MYLDVTFIGRLYIEDVAAKGHKCFEWEAPDPRSVLRNGFSHIKMLRVPDAVVQALDASVEGSWPKDTHTEADGGDPDVEVVLSSGDFSNEASAISAAGSSSSSCCSSERPSSPGDSFSRLSSSTADLSSLSSFCQRETHQCLTADGWKLHIMHVYDPVAEASTSSRVDSSSAGSRRPQHPVLMIPGLASSAEHTFDLLPDYSLVNALVARGYDVWLADLRGNGRSQKPSLLDRSTWWTVDHHLQQDVPAVLEYVLAATGAKQVHWIGHSMGGMLAVGLQSQQGKLASAIRSITMLASGCFGSGSWHSVLKPVINGITGYGFPAGAVLWAVSLLTGTAASLLPVEALFYWPCNMPKACARELMAKCFHFIPSGVIQQFMGSLNTKQGLTAVDGSFRYADPQQLQHVDVPVLALNGSWDLFCPPAGARRTVDLFGSKHKQFVCIGPTYGTGKRHYGHFDVVSGRNAAREVYPYVFDWLEQHDAPVSQ